MSPVPLDEFPVHQVPLSMRHAATSDRNFYDRCYLNAHDRSGEVFFVSGLGVYPNLGVIDAYATVMRGDTQTTLRLSDALGEDRMLQKVGPYSIEVVEPLRRVRLVCEENEHAISFDMTFTGSFEPIEEPRHILRQGGRIVLDASRFAQVGTWSGVLRLHGEEYELSEETWVGTRDRSWGIRPVGEPEPPGRAAAEPQEGLGFWWVYVPLRFEDYALLVMAQEDGNGTRTLNEAVRVWGSPDGSVRHEQLGWPEIDIAYRSGTRIPTGASIGLRSGRKTLELRVETLGHVALNSGPGYGGDPDWTHGSWRGRGFSEQVQVDLADPEVAARVPFGILDHVARVTLEGDQGFGMFEHGTFGAHTPSGFGDWSSVG